MDDDSRKIDAFFAGESRWHPELSALRAVLLDCGLTEEFKWRGPCYTCDGGNVATLWRLKENAALGLFKGVLLKDPEGLLVAPGENSRSMRVLKFTAVDQVKAMETGLRAYIREAVELEKAGARVDLRKDDIDYPEELIAALKEDQQLQAAFDVLTPGRKRGYALHFGQPKQAATRRSRIEKSRDRILAGKGMHDR